MTAIQMQLLKSYTSREVVMVDLVELINTVEHSCDSNYAVRGKRDWLADICLMKISDPQTADLIDSVLENGMMTHFNIIFDENGFSCTVGNGNHRLVACLLAGIWEVPVLVSPSLNWANTCGGDNRFEKIVEEYADSNRYCEALSEWVVDLMKMVKGMGMKPEHTYCDLSRFTRYSDSAQEFDFDGIEMCDNCGYAEDNCIC